MSKRDHKEAMSAAAARPDARDSVWGQRPYLCIALASMALHLAVSLWRTSDSYFMADDFLQLGMGRAAHFDLKHFARDLFGHVEPLTLMTQWLFAHIFGWNHAAAKSILLIESMLAVGAVTAVSARARAPVSIAAACAIIVAVCWAPTEGLRWWASGVQVVTTTLLTVAALWICAKPMSRLTTAERLWLAGLLLAATLFHNKGVFAIGLCAGARLFVIASSAPSASPQQKFGAAFADVLAALVTLIAATVFVFAMKIAYQAPSPVMNLSDTMAGLAVGVEYGWLASVAGVRVDAHSAAATLTISGAYIVLLAAVLIMAARAHNKMSAWLWLGLFASGAGSIALIASQRSVAFGIWSIAIGRFHVDMVFATYATITMAFGAAYVNNATPAPRAIPRTAFVAGAGIVVVALQLAGGWHYPTIWSPSANRVFVETLQHDGARLEAGQVVGNRPLPNRIAPNWMQPWNELASLASVLPRPIPTSSWDRATHYLADDGALHPFAALPRRIFETPDGPITLEMAPPIEDIGFFENQPADRAVGWFNPLLAPSDKMRIALVAQNRILAWATHGDRPDVAAHYGRGDMLPSGFDANLPVGLDHSAVDAMIVIDNRIGIILPRG